MDSAADVIKAATSENAEFMDVVWFALMTGVGFAVVLVILILGWAFIGDLIDGGRWNR